MKDENILYWLWLSERCGVASKDFGRLMSKYESPFDIYRLEDAETERIEGISPTLKQKLVDRSLEGAYSTLRYCKQKKIDIVCYSDKRYPSRLRSIEDPPVLLYVKGKLPKMDERLSIGIVGTRKMSDYGRSTAYKIAYQLASAGTVVVSGMALGVDGVAACGALSAGGSTVAVLGCGLSVVYPKEHARLMDEISRSCAVITEYPPEERPNGYNFPKRNRIISGLCQGVLVVEGNMTSGSLITARRAIDQGREVFALPGKVNESNSEGPNELIKNGALVALSAEDIIAHYDFLYHDCINYKGLRKAKLEDNSEEKALKKYGVSAVYKRVRGTAAKTPRINTEEPSQEIVKSQNTEEAPVRDRQIDISGLDKISLKVLEAMPMDKAITADALPIEGIDIGEVITAFTMLEINGIVESLPGGMYIRK